MKEQKKTMWTLRSKWDLDKVDELLNKLPPGHRDVETLKYISDIVTGIQ